MRFVPPPRNAVDPQVFDRPPLSLWSEFDSLLKGRHWPDIDLLNAVARRPGDNEALVPRFVAQTPSLLSEGIHYEQRIADRGEIATREGNWHDLLNALIWQRYPLLKAAMNARQVAEIAIAGPKLRTRAQCALTLFDEAGVVAWCHDPALLALWDAHDWHGLFWREREAWRDGRIGVVVFGHAVLEHALKAGQLLVGKALVVVPQSGEMEKLENGLRSATIEALAAAIRHGALLNDPQELRPLPLSGIPGWHAHNSSEEFYFRAPCFCPVRAGRRYPPPHSVTGLPTG